MWLNVRTFDCQQQTVIHDLSKLTKIEELKLKLAEVFDAPVLRQRLYYGGKLLVDGHSLFDYGIVHGYTIQLMIQPPAPTEESPTSSDIRNQFEKKCVIENENGMLLEEEKITLTQSKYFKVGDVIDAKCKDHDGWFEAKISAILKLVQNDAMVQKNENEGKTLLPDTPCNNEEKSSEFDPIYDDTTEENILYTVTYDDANGGYILLGPQLDAFYSYDESVETLPLAWIRPRAKTVLKYEDINEGDTVMVNYNVEESGELGFWYDYIVDRKEVTRTSKILVGTILIGENTQLPGCKINALDFDVFAIEKNTPLCDRKVEVEEMTSNNNEPTCKICEDLSNVLCKQCGCKVCGGKQEPSKILLCDECNLCYHIWCLSPPLANVPDIEYWYCPKCINNDKIIKPGEKLQLSKKKSKMASHSSVSSRDWGRGMACAGRTTQCTIVRSNHFGPIPGVEVGTMWKFRIQVSESGVHRPHVAGIHGRQNEGSFSICLSGGYPEDEDHGEYFTYTGSGGRDLSGNKREAKQSHDQVLTHENKALAISCAAPFSTSGAEAEDFHKGKPIRVVRNYKAAGHSAYAPKVGNRYDGIYKVAKYWPEKGQSGFIVWRYLLRYDDSAPLPWTEAGKKRAEELGLEMQVPIGYVEKNVKESNKGKRSLKDDEECVHKRTKVIFDLPVEIKNLISEDMVNNDLWQECLENVSGGSKKFLETVKENFSCICCQELVFDSVTTCCGHNICKKCLQNSYKAGIYACPVCRTALDKKAIFLVNAVLREILLKLFPGYQHGR